MFLMRVDPGRTSRYHSLIVTGRERGKQWERTYASVSVMSFRVADVVELATPNLRRRTMGEMYLANMVNVLKKSVEEKEQWKKDHDDPTRSMIFDIEDMAGVIPKMTESLFRRDNQEHIDAAKANSVGKLQGWEKKFAAYCKALIAVSKAVQDMATWDEVKQYKDVRIDVKELQRCEFRLVKALGPDADYMGRGDVIAAVTRAEGDIRAGRFEEDNLQEA
jgi:hypothetical protein